VISPWNRVDAVKATVLMAIGALVWFIGWWEVSDRASMDRQIAPMNIAVVGLIVFGAGQASWYLAGRRAVGRRRRTLLGLDTRRPVTVVSTSTVDGLFLGGGRFFHRPECAMITDRGWVPQPRAAHERAGRVPCGVCKP
jgi:hypothetical protein